MALTVQLLGAVTAADGARHIAIGGPRQRLVLAALAMSAGSSLSTDRLVDLVWGDSPPRTARRTLQSYVASIRRSLGGDVLSSKGGVGYMLDLPRRAVDILAFEDDVTRALVIAEADPESSRAILDGALRGWATPLGADSPADPMFAVIAPYVELHLQANEALAAGFIAGGDAERAVRRLEQLVRESPTRERLWLLLASGLASLGRRDEALGSVQRAREALRAELGIDLGRALAEYELQLLSGSGPAPAVFLCVPDRRVLHGRQSELERLVDRDRSGVAHMVLTGMGGAGKTALALEYTHRSRHDHAWIGWVTGGSRHSVIDGLARFAPSLGVNAKRQSGRVASDVVQALAVYDGPWVLVVDDVEGPQEIDGLLPQTGSGTVVVTTRHRGWTTTTFTEIEVGVLDQSAAVGLLLHVTGSADKDGAGRLVHRLGAHPLALEQAGVAIAERRWSFGRYERLLDERPLEILRLPATGVERTVAQVLESSIAQCRRESLVAENILGVCAYLAPDDIPRSLFEGVHAASEELVAGGDVMVAGDAVATLARFHIVNADDRHLGFHPLVQEIVRETFGSKSNFGAAAVRLVSAAQPQDPFDPSTWHSTRALTGHVDALIRNVRADGQAANLAYWTGSTLLQAGEYARALGLLRWAHGVALSAWGNRGVRTLDITNRLAVANVAVGDHEAAFPLVVEALDGRREILGPSHPDVLISINNVATGLLWRGDLAGAARLYEESLALHVDVMGSHHQDTLCVRNNLAHLHLDQGDVPAARRELDDIVDLARRFLGPRHPETLNWTNNLSEIMRSQGDFNAARALLDENVDACCDVLGDRHPETLISREILAQTMLAQAEAGPARDQIRLVLDARREALGANHSDTIATLDQLRRIEADADG